MASIIFVMVDTSMIKVSSLYEKITTNRSSSSLNAIFIEKRYTFVELRVADKKTFIMEDQGVYNIQA